MDQEPLLSGEEVAAYLGVPRPTLHQWRYRGEGPRSIKVGRHVRYRKADIEAWLDEQSDRTARRGGRPVPAARRKNRRE